jgi:Fe-S cluster biosynthesis and repair protein YggX
VYAYNNISQKAYAQGINDATLSMNRQILNSLQQSGYVPFYYVENNQTYQLKLIVEEKK